jgi:hypothetical protein
MKKYLDNLFYISFCHYMSPYINRNDYKSDTDLRSELHQSVLKTALAIPAILIIGPTSLFIIFILLFYFPSYITSKYIILVWLVIPNCIIYFFLRRELLNDDDKEIVIRKFEQSSTAMRKSNKTKAMVIGYTVIIITLIGFVLIPLKLSKSKHNRGKKIESLIPTKPES